MTTLAVVIALLGVGALMTLLGTKRIEWAHPPRGRLIDIGGWRQHVVELGEGADARTSGPPIVLLHGAGCNLEDMRLALGERLGARHHVILVDRPGQGWSERPGRQGSSPAYQAVMLRNLLDRLGVDRAIVVGHSWGGTLAATFALDHPQRVAGLVLLAPPTHPHLRNITWLYAVLAAPFVGWLFARTLALPFAAAAFRLGMRAPFRPQAPPSKYLKRSAAFLLLRPATFLANARDIADLEGFLARQVARYGALKAPTIIIAGDRDPVVSPHHHAMALAVSVPGAKLIVLPGLGHMLHHAAGERVIAAIEELVGRG
ncbi:MAG: alpha/beta hydrolase [Xanthobacteraceae bacterium]